MGLGRGASARIIVAAAAILVLFAAGWVGARRISQFRAFYPGDLTFVGNAEGLSSVRYIRLYVWKPPDYMDALPDLTLHVDGKPYPIAELTEDTVSSLGGFLPEGGLYDTEDNCFQYRFENGRLTAVSLMPSFRPASKKSDISVGGNVLPGRFYVSVGNGPPFALPVTSQELTAWAGPPETTGQHLPN